MSDNPNVFPAIRYQDGAAAIAWLTKAFGFEQHFVVPDDHDRVTHAELQIGRGMVMLNSKGDPRPTANPWDTVGHGIYVCIADVDAHYARAKAAGAGIARALTGRQAFRLARVLGPRPGRAPVELWHLRSVCRKLMLAAGRPGGREILGWVSHGGPHPAAPTAAGGFRGARSTGNHRAGGGADATSTRIRLITSFRST